MIECLMLVIFEFGELAWHMDDVSMSMSMSMHMNMNGHEREHKYGTS